MFAFWKCVSFILAPLWEKKKVFSQQKVTLNVEGFCVDLRMNPDGEVFLNGTLGGRSLALSFN